MDSHVHHRQQARFLATHSTRTSREGNTFPLCSLCSPGWSQAQDFPTSVLNQWIVVDATTLDKELGFSARLNEIGVSIGFFYLLTVPSWALLNPLSLRCAGTLAYVGCIKRQPAESAHKVWRGPLIVYPW